MGRTLGAVAIVVGALIIGFDPSRFDSVVFTLPRGHGVHFHDLVGMLFITLGIAVLWRSPRRA